MEDDYLEYEKDTKSLKSINLDDFSVKELKEYIDQLIIEKERVSKEIEKKMKLKVDADKFFK
tara:strand:+ start:100 stop:285 length:186 start_codon:yes stop_codon:yes gene_type:complete